MSNIVNVTALPDKLPWVEGVDYEVIAPPLLYGLPARLRDETGESFFIYTETGPSQPPAPKTLIKTDFRLYAVSQLGGGTTGMARFQAIMDAAAAATGAVRFCFTQYQDATSVVFPDFVTFSAILLSGAIITQAEHDAVINNWPT